jgi:hypothetical protein
MFSWPKYSTPGESSKGQQVRLLELKPGLDMKFLSQVIIIEIYLVLHALSN